MFRLLCFLLLFLFSECSHQLFAQEDKELLQRISEYKARVDTLDGDDLIQHYYNIADVYRNVLPIRDSQQYYINFGQRIAQDQNNVSKYAYGLMLHGEMEQRLGKYERALEFYQDGTRRFAEIGDTTGLAMMANAEAGLASTQGNTQLFVEKTLQAALLFEQQGDLRGMGICYLNLGITHDRLRQYRKSDEYYKKAYEIKNELNDAQLSRLLLCRSILYLEWYEHESIDSLLDLAATCQVEGNRLAGLLGQPKLQAQFIHQRIKLAKLKGEYDIDLLPVVDSALVFARRSRSDHILVEILYIKAGLLLITNSDLSLARELADSSVYYAEQYGRDYISRNAHKARYEVAKAQGDFQQALADLEIYQGINDSLISQESIERISEIEAGFEIEQREGELQLLRKEEQLNLAKVRRWRWLTAAAILVTILLSGLLYFYFRQRQLKSRHQAIQIEQQLLRAQMNPHFIFNSLNSIKRLYHEGETEQGDNYLADFSSLLRQILERSSKTFIPIEEEIDFLRLYLELERRRMSKPLNYTIEVDSILLEQDLGIPALILQPIVENSIWHGITQSKEDGQIDIRIDLIDDFIVCKIVDNGIGFETAISQRSSKYEAKGIELIRQRLGPEGRLDIREIKVEYGFGLRAGSQGTEVVMRIPLI